MEKTYEDFAAQELRTAARVLVQEARGTGGIAHIGTKEQQNIARSKAPRSTCCQW